MSFGRSDNNGGFIVFPAFHASEAGQGAVMEVDIHEWQKKFWSIRSNWRGEVPMPIMVGNTPYWRGVDPGWDTPDVKIDKRGEDKVFVGGFDLKTYRVAERHVRLPNDAEYKKHFQKAVESGTFYLRAERGGYVLARRWKARA